MNHIERLERLATVVMDVPDENFRLSCWMDKDDKCGCAVGWAAKDPALAAEGLSLTRPKDGVGYTPAFDGGTVWEAVTNFFGLTLSEAWEMFASIGPVLPSSVAPNSRNFMERSSVDNTDPGASKRYTLARVRQMIERKKGTAEVTIRQVEEIAHDVYLGMSTHSAHAVMMAIGAGIEVEGER